MQQDEHHGVKSSPPDTGERIERVVSIDGTRKHLLIREVSNETVVYDGMGRQVHVLNAVARRIWDCVCSGMSVASIADAIETEFSAVPRDELATQIIKCIENLRKAKLIGADRLPGEENNLAPE